MVDPAARVPAGDRWITGRILRLRAEYGTRIRACPSPLDALRCADRGRIKFGAVDLGSEEVSGLPRPVRPITARIRRNKSGQHPINETTLRPPDESNVLRLVPS